MSRARTCLAFFLVVASAWAVEAGIFRVDLWAQQDQGCERCHYDQTYTTGFAASVHARNSCASCHGFIKDLGSHMRGADRPKPVDCTTCHERISREYLQNFHYLQEDFRCVDCHGDIHTRTASKVPVKIRAVKACTRCHLNEEYVASGHAEALLRGNMDAASCMDCHGLHDTRVYHTALRTYPEEARMFYNTRCIACHSDAAMMGRNALSAKIVEYYEETYHGKVQDVGFATLVAGCADCHTTHNILPKTDPRSSIHPDNLVTNCGRCHTGFHPRFVLYKAHPDYRDRQNYPALYWTFVFMSSLLVVTFLFFWVHTALWWRKSYWEKHRREKEGIVEEGCLITEGGHVHVERFSRSERLMHLVLICSFFTLVTTGFPLKYHREPWAPLFLDFWGGAHMAGVAHRIAAAVLILLFSIVAWRSVRFVVAPGAGWKGWKERLFGPDSLFPRWKDWEDLKGMVLWFFDRGEKPRFDRWTYWEKFDFWAVFWGMFAIGGSGVLLWSPELSSYIVPGWVLNVASLVHSEEALLAALFIFTVHFFNTHFVPDKFPMDRLIFTGTYSIDELKRHRPQEYERLASQGKLDELKRPHPGIPLKLAAAVVGLASLLFGSLLTVLFIVALVGR
ncbi:MAG TPA: cytochrome b/b6 domain-containing protein [Deltaproteobacteria bacterium]|nr:cytochrome b/b6 domain-containing protein [Deltaproteobacteria bacterium]HPP81135.1 cytochrome b/b6 domain-containing protein [Deltaproteobacteria bacterium]